LRHRRTTIDDRHGFAAFATTLDSMMRMRQLKARCRSRQRRIRARPWGRRGSMQPSCGGVCGGRLGFSGATDPGEAAQGFAGASLPVTAPQPFAATFAAGAWPAMTPSPLPCRLNDGCCLSSLRLSTRRFGSV
jgi:hypothetical protein